MQLREHLESLIPRENSGSRSSDRFQYQQNWALCLLLTLHSGDENYVLVLDFHDDVAVIDSDSEPTHIDFYQVKTSDASHWTLQDLLRRRKGSSGEKKSHLGKLAEHTSAFGEHVRRLCFVSNSPFRVELENGMRSIDCAEICIANLSTVNREQLARKLQKELGLGEVPDLDCLFYLVVSDLALRDHVGHALGKVEQFLQSQCPAKKVRSAAFYRTLSGEIRRRNDFTSGPTKLEELIKNKAITRTDFQRMLDFLPVERDMAVFQANLTADLQKAGYNQFDIDEMRSALRKYELERTADPTDVAIQSLVEATRSAIGWLRDSGTRYETLREKFGLLLPRIRGEAYDEAGRFSEAYLKAAVIYESYEE